MCEPTFVQFGKYLSEKQRPEWQDKYLQYNALKDLIKEASREQEEMVSSCFLFSQKCWTREIRVNFC
jgi:SPX domain protein involved in polyphosphate accumulation